MKDSYAQHPNIPPKVNISLKKQAQYAAALYLQCVEHAFRVDTHLLVVSPERGHSVEGLGELGEDGRPRHALQPLKVAVDRPIVHLQPNPHQYETDGRQINRASSCGWTVWKAPR